MSWQRLRNALTTLEFALLGVVMFWGVVTGIVSLVELLRGGQ